MRPAHATSRRVAQGPLCARPSAGSGNTNVINSSSRAVGSRRRRPYSNDLAAETWETGLHDGAGSSSTGGRALKRPNSERHPPTSPDFRQKCGGRRSRTLGASRCLPLTASAARRRARGPSSSASCVTLPPCAGHCREGVIGAAARRRSVCPGPAYGTRKSTAQTSSPMVGPGLRPGRGRASKLFFAAAAKANSVVPHCQTGASASAIAPLWAE
jgi:hypothetical protein